VRPIYLDNNATTRMDPEVLAAMVPYFTEQFGNASSTHSFGTEVGSALKQARQHLQTLLGAAFDYEIIFTSGVPNPIIRQFFRRSKRRRAAMRS